MGGLGKVDGGRCGGALPTPGSLPSAVGRVAADGAGVGGWEVGARGVGGTSNSAGETALNALAVSGGSTGKELSHFQTGEPAGMGSGAAPLEGTLMAQGYVFPMMAAQREHRS